MTWDAGVEISSPGLRDGSYPCGKGILESFVVAAKTTSWIKPGKSTVVLILGPSLKQNLETVVKASKSRFKSSSNCLTTTIVSFVYECM